MANTNIPGYIVIGVTHDAGVAGSYEGVTEEEAKSFDPSKIADVIKHYVDPVPSFGIYKPELDGNKYIVIRILPFDSIPHICIRPYSDVVSEGDIYIRSEGARTTNIQSS